METICLTDFKLTGVNKLAISSLYTNSQVILKFYKNIGIFDFKGLDTFYGPVSIQINWKNFKISLFSWKMRQK